MTWIGLLTVFVVLGMMRPGRLGSTYVGILVASAAVLGYAFIGFGS